MRDAAIPNAGDREREIVSRFHRHYYNTRRQTWENTYWLGTPTSKCPFDLWVYQELIYETRPDLIIETGTFQGGSALFLASILDLLGSGEVVTIDIVPDDRRPRHPRITYIEGSSTDPGIVAEVTERAHASASVMVILDSDHREAHVSEELRLLAPLVTAGNYLIIEDTNINGNPVFPGFGPGPREALNGFLAHNDDFSVDHSREKLMLTFNPGGYVRKRGQA